MDIFFWENTLFVSSFVFYCLATVNYLHHFFSSKKSAGKWAILATTVGAITHTSAIILRTIAAQRAPLSNQYEFASAFALGIVICYIYLEQQYKAKYKVFGAFVMPFAVMIMAYAATLPKDIRPLMPALQSWWLKFHVGTAIFAYGSFAIACGLALMYLYRLYREESPSIDFVAKKLPDLTILDEFIYKTVAFGFLFQTLVIVTGAVWAEQAWGRYWGWDPKETWSLVTWCIYAIYHHARFTREWGGKKTAWLAIIGFVAVLFTYIGVNVLLPSLHSYR